MKSALVLAVLAGLFSVSAAHAEVQDCIPITALPAVISVQGIHCFTQDLATNATTGNAITINAPNVIIEMNGFKLGGLGAGAATQVKGIYAYDRQNITIRNGAIRGFRTNIYLDGANDGLANSGHVIEDMRIQSARYIGIYVKGTRSTIRNNLVFDTGSTNTDYASGISIYAGTGHTIAGNIITGVTGYNHTRGMVIDGPAHIRGNDIRDLSGDYSVGIYSEGSRTLIEDNFISNATEGNHGIHGVGASDACRNNAVTNFNSPLTGCDVSTDNTIF